MIISDDKVRWPSIKKYPCKKGKGEHEYLEPILKYKPEIRYVYRTKTGILFSGKIEKDYRYLRTEVSVVLETTCKNCGHKCVSYLTDNIK